MDTPRAFIGKTERPTAAELSAALGASAEAWSQLVHWLQTDQGIDGQEWKSTPPSSGWSMRLKLRKRTIVYLVPCNGCFRVAFALGDRAVAAAREAGLHPSTLKLLEEAPRYAEGTGLRLIVQQTTDLDDIRKLALIKLAN